MADGARSSPVGRPKSTWQVTRAAPDDSVAFGLRDSLVDIEHVIGVTATLIRERLLLAPVGVT